jgi:dipeptidyl aminopeptidase
MPPPTYNRLVEHFDDDDDDIVDQLPSTSLRTTVPSHASPTPVRPEVYYGDGPFDPPSSDEEDETLLDKDEPSSPGFAEEGSFGDSGSRIKSRQRPASLRALIISLVALVTLAGIIGIIAAHTYKGTNYRLPGATRITMDHVFNGTFSPDRQSLHWVPEAGDGVFSIFQGGVISLVDLKTNSTRALLKTEDVKDEHGRKLQWSDWKLSADMKYVLVKADRQKQWRWSSFGNYYVHNLETRSTHPIIPPTNPPTTAYATWSPTGESIAYVSSNDLYVLTSPDPSTTPIRVTTSGNASLFHGVPDWVYEEEIFSADFALWWSPDSTKLAFLRFDETAVDEFKFPVYNPTDDSNAVIPYTSDVIMKYPKPGFNNPLVSVHVFDVESYLNDGVLSEWDFPAEDATLTLDWTGRHPLENSIIAEVAWVANATLLVKEVNRNADDGSVVLFDLVATNVAGRATGQVVRKLGKAGEEGDDGWIDQAQNIHVLPESVGGISAYLDVVPTPEGFNHIALFSPANTATPRFLTSGEWEVTGGIQAVDAKRGLVYFQAARPSPIERHLYSVPIPTISASGPVEPTVLTDTSESAYFNADFSPEAGFYLLSYEGPDTPWQRVVEVNNTAFDYVLTDNARLNETWSVFEAPTITYSTIESDGYGRNFLAGIHRTACSVIGMQNLM